MLIKFTSQKKSYFYAVSAVLLWSTVSTAFKIALEFVDFLQLLLSASAVTLVILPVIAALRHQTRVLFSISGKQLLHSALLGFLNPFLYYVILLKAYSILPAQLAQPLNYLWPVMLVLLSVPLLKQKLSRSSLFAVLMGFAGVYIISTRGEVFNIDIQNPFGVFLAAGSSIIWAFFWIFNQKDERNELNKLFWNFVFGFVYILIATLLFSELPVFNWKSLSAVVYVGLFETGITFYLWMRSLQLTETNSKISNLVFLSPFLALIFIHFILKEEIMFTTPIGLVFIIVGIFVQQTAKLKNT
jgi:drug/metabolite transporter (DMT)-like permease